MKIKGFIYTCLDKYDRCQCTRLLKRKREAEFLCCSSDADTLVEYDIPEILKKFHGKKVEIIIKEIRK